MKRFFYGLLAFLFLFLSIYPFSNVFADDLIITGTPSPVQGDITDEQLQDIIVAGITADLVSQGYQIDLSASDGDWDNFKNSILDYIFNSAASGSGFWGEIYNSALYHNLIDENFTLWYPDNSDGTILPGISKRSIYRNLSENLINNILDSRSDDSNPEPTPQPLPDFSFISNINYLYFGNIDINSITNFYLNYSTQSPTFINPLSSYTLVSGFENNNQDGFTPYHSVNNYFTSSMNVISALPKLSIYLTTNQDNSISVSYSNFAYTQMISEKGASFVIYHENATPNGLWFRNYTSSYGGQLISSYPSLSVAINNIYKRFYNINLYVDGVPWVIADNNSQVLPTININPGYVLQGTDYPLIYNFPEPPSFDYQRMIDIIKHALLQYGVIKWEDIADVFVDVNGQTAVAILEIHRNDYDVLYDEQYPGIALPNRFNTHLLDTSHQYLSPVVQTVEETTGVLPGEIKGALAIGMMLTIFACLIHRLLE